MVAKTNIPSGPAGTVSRILWHFTGGPSWSKRANRQNRRLKPAPKAYENLLKILRSGRLRCGGYRETLTGVIPEVEHFKLDPQTLEVTSSSKEKNFHVRRESSARVCCLAEIPVIHLAVHARRYGKMAIGFHRSSALRNGFNPVLYVPENSHLAVALVEALRLADEKIANYSDLTRQTGRRPPLLKMLRDAESDRRRDLEMFAAFTKTFSEDEFGSVYCEREWRSTKPYDFQPEDIAMIVLPRKMGHRSYFDEFVERDVNKTVLLRYVPIVPWEDLVEH